MAVLVSSIPSGQGPGLSAGGKSHADLDAVEVDRIDQLELVKAKLAALEPFAPARG